MKYRKKPVVIDAMRWTGAAQEFIRWHHEIGAKETVDSEFQFQGARLAIITLEGVMFAEPGDWIICGVKGEFYPCKPHIFAATYEAVDGEG